MTSPTTTTRPLRHERRGTFEALRAEALFVSTLQSSDSPSPDQIRRDVATAIRAYGVRGCAARLAGEFGDHPERAAARMRWALETIRDAYPARSSSPAFSRRYL